jgi:hypothetical protein
MTSKSPQQLPYFPPEKRRRYADAAGSSTFTTVKYQ